MRALILLVIVASLYTVTNAICLIPRHRLEQGTLALMKYGFIQERDVSQLTMRQLIALGVEGGDTALQSNLDPEYKERIRYYVLLLKAHQGYC